MTFSERGREGIVTQTAPSAWNLDTLVAVVTSADMTRVKNILIQGVYSIDQSTEANSQFGLAALVLMKFPDGVSTPDPDLVEGGGVTGVDRQIFKWRYIWTAGQNNPVLFTMRFRAINVKPGEKLILGKRIQQEGGVSLNHRFNTTARWWQDDG